MRQRAEAARPSAEKVIKDIRQMTRKQYGVVNPIRGPAPRGPDQRHFQQTSLRESDVSTEVVREK